MTAAVRLHKLMARRGVASLRASERLIAEGRVSVNGVTVTDPGAVAMPGDRITVDGEPIGNHTKHRYVMLHKPVGVITTASDEYDRQTVTELVGAEERLYPVGRLDRDSEGLVLLTNDGALAQRLMHPRFQVHKEYHVDVAGGFTQDHLPRLRAGVQLEDGPSRPLGVRILRRAGDATTLSVVMGEGRKRQVRRTLEALGFPVVRLVRVALGPLRLDGLRPGEHRELNPRELRDLKSAAGLAGEELSP